MHSRVPANSAATRSALGGPAERTTDTGWRLVGSAASLLNEVRPLEAGDAHDVVYAARFRVRPWLASTDALTTTLQILSDAIARELPEAPALSLTAPASWPATRHTGLSWRVTGTRGNWAGELLWRHAHPVTRGVACTTHVFLEEVPQILTCTVRTYADGGPHALHGAAGVGQARPAFLSRLARECRLQCPWGEAAPVTLTLADINPFVSDVLLGDREWPVVVLSTLATGEHVIPPTDLATELLGLARVYALDAQATSFVLTDALGDKRLSCFHGAMRVYLPHFSCADNPFDHPLYLAESVADPMERAELAGRLALEQRMLVTMPQSIAERRERQTPASTRAVHAAHSPDSAHATTSQATTGRDTPEATRATPQMRSPTDVHTVHGAHGASPDHSGTTALAEAMVQIAGELRALSAAVTQLTTLNRDLFDEVARLRNSTAVRHGSLASIERRLERLDGFVRAETRDERVDAPSATDAPSNELDSDESAPGLSLPTVLRLAAEQHADALLILESAERSAAESPYEDVERVAAVLDAMADISRRRQQGTLGMPVRQAFREVGVDYRGFITEHTPDRQRQQFLAYDDRGHAYDCREHIALGAGTYDPRYVLRIYFTSRDVHDPRFVIGHVGRHLRVLSTT